MFIVMDDVLLSGLDDEKRLEKEVEMCLKSIELVVDNNKCKNTNWSGSPEPSTRKRCTIQYKTLAGQNFGEFKKLVEKILAAEYSNTS